MRDALLVVLMLCFLPATAQHDGRYLSVAEKFKDFYNCQQDDSIHHMFTDARRNPRLIYWEKGSCKDFYRDYGKILSVRYMMQYQGRCYYKTVCEKSTHYSSAILDPGDTFREFQFEDGDPEIEMIVTQMQKKVARSGR